MAQIKIHRDGTVETLCGTQDIGGGARTVVLIQTSREFNFLPLHMIRVKIGNSAYGSSGASAGSSTTAGVSMEIAKAARRARRLLFETVAEGLNCPVEAVSLGDSGSVRVSLETIGRRLSWKKACLHIEDTLVAAASPPLQDGNQWFVFCKDGRILQASESEYLA